MCPIKVEVNVLYERTSKWVVQSTSAAGKRMIVRLSDKLRAERYADALCESIPGFYVRGTTSDEESEKEQERNLEEKETQQPSAGAERGVQHV